MNFNDKGILNTLNISEVGITDGIIGWWPLNGDTKDYTENRNHGKNSGSTVTDGLNELCYEFDGVDDYIDIGDSQVLKLNSGGSICSWVNFNSFNGSSWSSTIVGKGYSSWPNHHYILFKESGTTRLLFSVSDGTNFIGTSGPKTPPLSLDTWYFVVATWDDLIKSIYLDGSLCQSISSDIMPIDSADPISIGKTGTSGYYTHGKIQDVRLYNRALTSEEIYILYDITNPRGSKMKIDKEGKIYIKGQIKEV